MAPDHYTIRLAGGKYTVINRNGLMEFLRFGEAWPAAKDLQCGVVLALAQRIEELEVALRAALDGSLDPQGKRRYDGMNSYSGHSMIAAWSHDLRNVLEQKP